MQLVTAGFIKQTAMELGEDKFVASPHGRLLGHTLTIMGQAGSIGYRAINDEFSKAPRGVRKGQRRESRRSYALEHGMEESPVPTLSRLV